LTALHISITYKGDNRFEVSCDNLRREDAKPEEIGMANLLERLEVAAIHEISSEIVSQSFTQEGPGAKDEA
jgi:hypothetical protein